MTEEPEREHVGRTVEQELGIHASPEEVYAAWAEPEKIARWFVDAASGECKPGSVMTWRFDSMQFEMPVPIAEAEPGRKIAIAGEIPGRPPFLQEVFIEKQGGATRLRLLNSGFGDGAEWDDEYEGVDSGWQLALATLKHVLERHPKGARSHVFRMRPGRYEYAPLAPLYFTGEGLASWLAERAEIEGSDARPGARVSMQLGELGALDGAVLARSGRELLVSWPERDAALGIKAFALGPHGRAIALDYNSWTDGAEDEAAVGAFLERALERLHARVS